MELHLQLSWVHVLYAEDRDLDDGDHKHGRKKSIGHNETYSNLFGNLFRVIIRGGPLSCVIAPDEKEDGQVAWYLHQHDNDKDSHKVEPIRVSPVADGDRYGGLNG